VLTRRTRISIEYPHRGVDSAAAVVELIAPILGWDQARCDREIDQYRARVAAERESQSMSDDADADAVRLIAPDARPSLIDAPALTL
jgi:glycerol-3-phosphate dehydrogenase